MSVGVAASAAGAELANSSPSEPSWLRTYVATTANTASEWGEPPGAGVSIWMSTFC